MTKSFYAKIAYLQVLTYTVNIIWCMLEVDKSIVTRKFPAKFANANSTVYMYVFPSTKIDVVLIYLLIIIIIILLLWGGGSGLRLFLVASEHSDGESLSYYPLILLHFKSNAARMWHVSPTACSTKLQL